MGNGIGPFKLRVIQREFVKLGRKGGVSMSEKSVHAPKKKSALGVYEPQNKCAPSVHVLRVRLIS